MKHNRAEILKILYNQGARSSTEAINYEDVISQFDGSLKNLQQEITYLKDKGYILVKERQMRSRIFRWIYLTAEGVDLIEAQIQEEPQKHARKHEKYSPINFVLQLSLRDASNFEVRGIETPMGEPLTCSRLPYTPDELNVILKVLRFTKYEPNHFTSDQHDTLEQLGLVHNSHFVQDMLRRIGETLYNALMQGDVHTAIQMSLTQARSKGPVSLQLRFDESAVGLALYPWELLYHRRMLLPSRAVELTRYISYPEAVTSLPVTPPLQLVYVQARPTDLSSLPHDLEQQTIQQALNDLAREKQLNVHILPWPTYETLVDFLETNQAHILHFDGHGVFARQCPACAAMNYPGKSNCASCNQDISYIEPHGYLAFEDGTHHVHWISNESLSTLLYNRQLRLIVLSACRTGSVGGDTLFGGTAPSLIQAGIPAVTAMQLPISVDAATKFMQGFYQALARLESVPAAVNAGRLRIFHTNEWFIPTLYLRSRDNQGNLFSQQ